MTAYVPCLKCRHPMIGIMDRELRDHCCGCGGKSKAADSRSELKQRQKQREEAA